MKGKSSAQVRTALNLYPVNDVLVMLVGDKQTDKLTIPADYKEKITGILMELENYNTSITREAFEAHFTKAKESVRFTFNGWDGKSYDGESRSAKVIRTNLPGYEEVRLVKA